ncbi:MAG TPA: metal-sulfur cluster assembly factor [Chloroflexota bacterium]|nr:metal-sulfur cluster assembly factor [Chloroflexota bacterium]
MYSEEQVMECLREINDPELGINLVDLGLIRDVAIEDRKVIVTYTLTTPACPMNEYIDAEVVETLKERLPEVEAVIPKLSWEPLWDPSQMTEDAKLELGFF